MKSTLLLCLLLCGCGHSNQADPAPLDLTPHAYYALNIVEANGHRFAITHAGNGIAICEVTDASLVKTNAEAAK